MPNAQQDQLSECSSSLDNFAPVRGIDANAPRQAICIEEEGVLRSTDRVSADGEIEVDVWVRRQKVREHRILQVGDRPRCLAKGTPEKAKDPVRGPFRSLINL